MGKSKNKVTNWPESNRALTQRGSITFWVDKYGLALNITESVVDDFNSLM